MIKSILALFLFLFLGCSKIETGLNFAPRIATSKIDDAFDFDSVKLSKIRKQIDADIQKSKKDLALKIIDHIEMIEKKSVQTELKTDEVIVFFDSISETQTALLNGFKTTADLVFKDLSEHEIKTFKEYSDKKFEEELELIQDKKAFRKKKRQSFLKNYEIFLGQVTLEQEKIVEEFIDKNIDYYSERILARQKFSEEFYLKIKSKDPVLDFFLSRYEGKKYFEISDLNMKNYLNQIFQLQNAIWKTTTDKQKKYLKRTLENYKKELQKIAAAK